jgi:hypothetical protein
LVGLDLASLPLAEFDLELVLLEVDVLVVAYTVHHSVAD